MPLTPPAPRPSARHRQRSGPRAFRAPWVRVRSIVTSVILGMLVLLAVLTVGVPFVLGAEPYTVLTGSMRPNMPPGSLIGARPTPFADIRVGDVVTYQMASGQPAVVTHRVVGTVQDGNGERMLVTRGDANDVADENPVRGVQVRGVVVYAVPFLGYPGALVAGTTRSVLALVIGSAVIAYGALVILVGEVRSRRATAPGGSTRRTVRSVAEPTT